MEHVHVSLTDYFLLSFSLILPFASGVFEAVVLQLITCHVLSLSPVTHVSVSSFYIVAHVIIIIIFAANCYPLLLLKNGLRFDSLPHLPPCFLLSSNSICLFITLIHVTIRFDDDISLSLPPHSL